MAYNHATQKGIKSSEIGSVSDRFSKELQYNNAVFAAFKTHRQQNDIAKLLTDENGKLKSFSQFSKDSAPVIGQYNKTWLKTEYNTAIHRAQQAANWQQFEAEKDVLPNLEWMPTTSANPGEDHRPFWGMVAPIDDGCWFENRPGDRWNCKCSLQATDKNTVAPPSNAEKNNEPDAGLDNNPGVDGKIFSDSHPYVADAYQGAEAAVTNFIAGQDIEEPEPVKDTNFKSGGLLRIPVKFNQGKQEVKKNIKAYTELAKKYGDKYELLNIVEKPGIKNPDALNLKTGKTSDAKMPESKITKNAIQNSIKEASKQEVGEVYIYLNNKASMMDVWAGMKSALQHGRAKTIQTIIVRFKDGSIKRYETSKLRKVFNRKTKGTH